MAFFHAQHVLGLNTEILNIKFPAGFLYHEPDRLHIGRGHMQFIGQLSHETEAHGLDRNRILNFEFLIFRKSKGFIGKVDI